MGRRSINTTKSGKYMNPTDQARKEARKKELKKNKRQRQAVRAAVLKMKDPQQIIEELDKIDEMEFNVLQPSPLNEKVLKEKRKKLRETFDRVLKMYDKDEPEKWVELKRQEMEYEKRRAHLISYYESVKHAQSVQVDDIPLPTLPTQVPEHILFGNMSANIPMPAGPALPIKPILKKDITTFKQRPTGMQTPGVPPGPPPDYEELLGEIEEAGNAPTAVPKKKTIRFTDVLEDDGPPGETDISPQIMEVASQEDMGESPQSMAGDASAPKPTSLQQRMLALSGQNIDEFMKEMEEVHKKRERDRAADLSARLSALDKRRPEQDDSDSDDDEPALKVMKQQYEICGLQPPGTEPRAPPPHHPPLPPPGFRPPPLRVPLGPPPMRAPPGPPPGRPTLPPGPPPGLPPRMLRPPGPPPGAPPRMLRPPVPPPPPKTMPVSVLSAAPQLIQKKEGPQGATISAKPQIRNLSADVTRFVPSALRVKRESKKPTAASAPKPVDIPQQPTKDDAYMQFMKEMQGLL